MELNDYLIALLYLLAGAVCGFIAEKILLKKILASAQKTKWKGDNIIISSTSGIILFWGIAAGVHFAIHYIPADQLIKSWANKILFTLIILSFCIVISRILIEFIKLNTIDSNGDSPSTSIIANIVRVVIYLLGILIILQSLGISITPLITALGVGGLAVALALQDTLSNLFAGLQILASRHIRLNDYVKIESGQEGYIADINWRNTTIRALGNNMVIIPNSKMASNVVVNYNLPEKEIPIGIEVGVSYDSDLEMVERLTIETGRKVLRTIEGGVKNYEPAIRYHTFADSSINFSVGLRCHEYVNQYLIKHEFIKALHTCYKENNIDIPFPIRTIHINEKK